MGTLKLIQYPSQLLSLTISDIINKQNLSQLIQKSKKMTVKIGKARIG